MPKPTSQGAWEIGVFDLVADFSIISCLFGERIKEGVERIDFFMVVKWLLQIVGFSYYFVALNKWEISLYRDDYA